MHTLHRRRLVLTSALAIVVFWTGCSQRKPGEPIHPGFNVYSKEQDIQLGQEASAEVRKQVQVVQNRQLQSYVSEIGQKLASQPEANDYPYSFTLIKEDSINAFALPGGPIFVHSGLLKAADNEAQLAGVLAHEIAHVALRHATNQASKANLIQLPAVLAGAAIGDQSALAQLGQLGLGLGVNSLMLKYSRDAESQADALGARLMAEAGYNPIEMAHFFEKLEAEGGARAPQFLSSHPNPGNRVKAVQAEIQALPQRQYNTNTGEFPQAKTLVAQLPPPERNVQRAAAARPDLSVEGFRRITLSTFSVAVPANWQVFGDRRSPVITMAPQGGLVQNSSGAVSMGYGAVASYYRPQSSRSLRGATQELLRQLQSVNPGLGVSGGSRQVLLNGQQQGLVTTLSGRSPYGGSERNVLVTVARPEGLFYIVFVAPTGHMTDMSQAYQTMLDSVRFSG